MKAVFPVQRPYTFSIRITRLCDLYPLAPHFYIVIFDFTGICIIFLNFALKHRLLVLVRACHTIYVLSKNKKHITLFHLKIVNFIAIKNQSILHRRFIVMF